MLMFVVMQMRLSCEIKITYLRT